MAIKTFFPTTNPALSLNFAQTKRLDPRISFSRASTGTYVGSDGLIKTAPNGVPRFDHDPATGESLGLLVEEARTNSQTYGNDFTNWTLNQNGVAYVTPNATIGLTGQMDASLLINDAGAYIKGPPFTVFNIGFNMGATYNLATKTISIFGGYGGAVVSATIDDVGNGWYRCALMPNTSTKYAQSVYAKAAGSNTITIEHSSESIKLSAGGGLAGSVYIWGAQVEAGTFPTSYIPTGASTATRAADVASITNSSIYTTDSFTIINKPYGTAAGASSLSLIGPTIERTAVYNEEISQTRISGAAEVVDNFWRWRILGTSFALPSFVTDGQVTVDWGDGTVETLTTSEHTFNELSNPGITSAGVGYYVDVGFRLDSGTYFRPGINNNATHRTKVVATGPAPAGMKLDAQVAFFGCSGLKAVDATIDATGGTNFSDAWDGCSSLTSFPLIDASSGTTFQQAWFNCTSLTSFPAIDASSGTNFQSAWGNCYSLTSFPLVDTSSGTNFIGAWQNCFSLTSFSLINTSNGTSFENAWYNCTSLTSFPLIDTSSGTNFGNAWRVCNSLTSFPLIDTSSATTFGGTWNGCTSLTSFPLIDTSAATFFGGAWQNCSNLTSFPLIDTSSGIYFQNAWTSCSSLTSFPLIDTSSGIDFTAAWQNCSSLTSFSLIDTSSGTNFTNAWSGCSSLTSFPLIDTSSGTNFYLAWNNCSSLTSFPLIDTSGGTNFQNTWYNCNSLTSFPLIDTSAGTNFYLAWNNCNSLTSFPLIDTSSGTSFQQTWQLCYNLTSFPLIDTSAGTNFYLAWQSCSSLTSFPLIDTSSGTTFQQTWQACSSLTSFPLIDTSSGTTFQQTWQNCYSLTTFPAGFFDTWTGTPVNNCFVNAWDGCTALTATSVENILNSIDTSGQSAPASGVDITIDYNAGSGTPSVATAVTNLKGRGWTITLNGVAQ